MKQFFAIAVLAALTVAAVSCKKEKDTLPSVTVAVTVDGQPFAVEGVKVALADQAGTASYEALTDASGNAKFKVLAGSYRASASYRKLEGEKQFVYNGAADITVAGDATFPLALNKVECSQVIIKELYMGGVMINEKDSFSDDAYIILYNNSDKEADATDIAFGILNPSNGHASNKFISDGKLSYEDAGYVPAYSAVWNFKNSVKIPAYSQIVVVCFSAIDNSATYPNSVDLSKAEYYWMSNTDISATYKAAKYKVSDAIPTSHYLTTTPFNSGTAWVLSNTAPALFIANMNASAVNALVSDTATFDTTAGATAAFWAPKFPTANILDAIEVWNTASIEKSNYRFPAKVNTGYIGLTNKAGYSLYRNVDKEATEALAENEGKLVYNYAGGTADIDGGTTDPSGIDAEASIKAGAHIIYSDTNDSSKDFHQRKVSSIK